MNLDGTDAAREFSLPRLELHCGSRGWTSICLLPDGNSRRLSVGKDLTAPGAKRAAIGDALLALGEQYESELRSLLE